jgi:hypothetical protein
MADGEQTLDAFLKSLKWSERYPRHASGGDIPEHALKALEKQLNIRSDELFCNVEKAAVAFFELRRNDEGKSTALRVADL